MSDVFTKQKRSEVMSKIRGHGNKVTEIALMNLLRFHRISGWRRNQNVLGKPDFVFYKFKLAVFVDGCFWHGCPKHSTQPKTNQVFWERKLSNNRNRDKQVNRGLRKLGWRVIRIWEHDLKKCSEKCARKIQAALHRAS